MQIFLCLLIYLFIYALNSHWAPIMFHELFHLFNLPPAPIFIEK